MTDHTEALERAKAILERAEEPHRCRTCFGYDDEDHYAKSAEIGAVHFFEIALGLIATLPEIIGLAESVIELVAENELQASRLETIARRNLIYYRDGILESDRNKELTLENERLIVENERLTVERDLAIAHDQQPYPTAEAYELACKALKKSKAENRELSKGVRCCKGCPDCLAIGSHEYIGQLRQDNQKLIEALKLADFALQSTREYVGKDLLPNKQGWSHFEACQRIAKVLSEIQERKQ